MRTRTVPRECLGVLTEVGRRLVSQQDARVLVRPRAQERGFWFGAGNLCRDRDGALLLCGRYRNAGDARTGIAAGPRGAEVALLRSQDGGARFEHVLSLLKDDVAPEGDEVLSIEGCCLRRVERGFALYVSSEKRRAYPPAVRDRQKPGTGVWSIDVLEAESPEALRGARARPVLCSADPERLHVKDPVVFDAAGRTWMIYCAHPFSWTSTTACLAAQRPSGRFVARRTTLLPGGSVWDVAACRVTARLPLPRVGVLADLPPAALYFYDGAECMRDHSGGGPPRGCSCEELGGLAAAFGEAARFGGRPSALTCLTREAPLFVSPYGTGASRYVSVFEGEGEYLVTWEQSQPDGSHPLVLNRVPKADVARILGGR